MDRILFGDNQFFAINHISEEKSRLQSIKFKDDSEIIRTLDAAMESGIDTFMCTTHDRIANICDYVRKYPEKYKDFKIDKAQIQKIAKARHQHQLKHPNNKDRINAGFYRAWEPQAYNSLAANYTKLAHTLPMPSYLIDDQTAIKVVDGVVEVVSEGDWKLIEP